MPNVGKSMDDVESVLWDLLKRTLDTRRTIVLTALGLVTAFGAIVVGKVLDGAAILDTTDCAFVHKAALFTGSTIFAWSIYIIAVRALSIRINELLQQLVSRIPSLEAEKVLINRSFMNRGYLLPIVLSAGIWAALIFPLEQQEDGFQKSLSWFTAHPWWPSTCKDIPPPDMKKNL